MATKFLKSPSGGIYKDSNGKLVAVDLSLPALSNPATAEDIASGKEAYGADGVAITGTAEMVENKLPLLVGVQSADNLYDITASDLDGVTELRGYAFAYCDGLRNIDLSNIEKTGREVFLSCHALTSVDIPNMTIVESNAFNSCTALTSVNMPNVKIIDEYGFNNCTALTSLTIPSTCTTIGKRGLSCGSSTNKCTFTFEGTTPPTIESNTFNTSYINKIIVPAGCGEAYKTATNWRSFASYIEEATA